MAIIRSNNNKDLAIIRSNNKDLITTTITLICVNQYVDILYQ